MSNLLLPATAMMLVTFVVWLKLFVNRVIATQKLGIDPGTFVTPEVVNQVFDDKVNAPSNCFKNLCEMPIVFYAICAFILITNSQDTGYVNLAWAFVGFRSLQAIVHCTYNNVMHRFAAYMLASVALWAMVMRFFLQLI